MATRSAWGSTRSASAIRRSATRRCSPRTAEYNRADLLAASYDPGIRPQPGQTNSPPALVDPNAGRPSRMINWNISVQRELTKDLVVEAAYVGNRGAWFRADGLNRFNGISDERLRSFGLDLNNAGRYCACSAQTITSPRLWRADSRSLTTRSRTLPRSRRRCVRIRSSAI